MLAVSANKGAVLKHLNVSLLGSYVTQRAITNLVKTNVLIKI